MTIQEAITRKLTSAQWLITVAIVGTYCISILLCIYLVVKGKLSIEAFLGLFTAFSTLAAAIVNSYFHKDREKPEILQIMAEKNKENKENKEEE